MPNRNDQITYLTRQIEDDRSRIESTEEQKAFDRMKEEIEEKLPGYLRDIF
jgi:hypothetical protein